MGQGGTGCKSGYGTSMACADPSIGDNCWNTFGTRP